VCVCVCPSNMYLQPSVECLDRCQMSVRAVTDQCRMSVSDISVRYQCQMSVRSLTGEYQISVRYQRQILVSDECQIRIRPVSDQCQISVSDISVKSVSEISVRPVKDKCQISIRPQDRLIRSKLKPSKTQRNKQFGKSWRELRGLRRVHVRGTHRLASDGRANHARGGQEGKDGPAGQRRKNENIVKESRRATETLGNAVWITVIEIDAF
jgi:hypothetical protein